MKEGTIIRKGTNYVVFEDMQRVWLHDLEEEPKKITKTKQAKGEVGDMKGTQPAKHYSKDTKVMKCLLQPRSARHFAKGDSRKQHVGIVQRLNHLSTPKSSNRCMVNKTKKRNHSLM